jgi:hypothetical protein
MAVMRVTMAFFLASSPAPTARVTERTTGMAMGTPPMSTVRMLLTPSRYSYLNEAYCTMMTTRRNERMTAMQNPPTAFMSHWKWPDCSVESTSAAALPKNELTPVLVTTISISPCLTVEPEKTMLPVRLVTGRDSPVRAWGGGKDRSTKRDRFEGRR